MAFPTAVNSQITDSVSQVNTKVLGDAPAVATGNFMLATSQALSNAAHNATTGQQNNSVTAQATLVQGVNTMFTIDVASAAEGTAKIYR
ncbi:glycerol-3-phosphate dehydrogenase [Shewanella sp. GutCb]|uniref:RebB family R body protein n=1 Tax=Shewanella sp. GutCb TaxID=2058315 RepID=UPI000C7AD551|nr:RebB family R body protein [Shewanella sp. GutCb]PKG76625.1 glycerol-3-phosphate dehydrogenase [Shewanella sp. GutCb]